LEKQKLKLARAQLLAARAAAMRASLTPSEERLWQSIRCRKLGVSFKRQVVLGSFIVDFCAPAARLVVEVDGGYHARRSGPDARRDRVLGRAGYRVLRLEAELVLRELPRALALVRQALGG
jgi:very-short-patch-repair endonuclease